ncbi:hypothetical protein DAPPUDRAFT_109941 [Daphnia pulex]|uniref:Uncharacterized protein n=1 Tax=Daphnia pulex TaxID=6669 RepID=E9H4N7_DAPPU|nr:hypothetical protein DAPPUDRAFT_109941 [Daphnia pulex]|eukprot:EFX73323.1 hypothetical protein DAPPUDRAFT_109941 [Daphnia pulex]
MTQHLTSHGLHHLLAPHEENERIVNGVNESQFFHVGRQPVEVAAIRLVDDPAQVEEANENEIRTGRDEERRHSDNQRPGGLSISILLETAVDTQVSPGQPVDDEIEREKHETNGTDRTMTQVLTWASYTPQRNCQTTRHLLAVNQRQFDGDKSVGQGQQHVEQEEAVGDADDGNVGPAKGIVRIESPVNQFDHGGHEKRQIRENDAQEENVPGFPVQTPVVGDGDGDGHVQRYADESAK